MRHYLISKKYKIQKLYRINLILFILIITCFLGVFPSIALGDTSNNSIIIGGTGGLSLSTDGLQSWTYITPDNLNYNDLYVADNRLMTVGTRGTNVGGLVGFGYITNSEGWVGPFNTVTSEGYVLYNPLYTAVYGNGSYVVAGGWRNGDRISTRGYTSKDGVNYNQSIDGYRNTTYNYNTGDVMGIIRDGVFGNGKFVLIGNADYINYTATSTDGLKWSIKQTDSALNYNSITYGNGKFVVVGKYPTGTGTFRPVIDTSIDGVNWTKYPQTPQIFNNLYNKQLKGVTYGGGKYVAVGTAGLVLYSTDALHWSIGTTNMTKDLNAVAYDDLTGRYIAVGSGGTVLSSSNGATWAAENAPYSNYETIAVFHGTLVNDTVPPVTTVKFSPSVPNGTNGWYQNNVSANLTATDNFSGVAKIEYRLNNGNWTTYTGAFTFSVDGEYMLDYRSTDKASNVEAYKTTALKIDKTAPVSDIQFDSQTPISGNTYSSDVKINISANDAVSGVAKTEYKINNGVLTEYNGTIPQLPAGSYTLQYRSTDKAGNIETFKSISFKIADNSPPVLDPIQDQTVDEGTLLQFTVHAIDPDGNPITYTASNLPKGATFDSATGVFSWTPDYTQAGTYPDVQFTASDGSLSISQSIAVTVNDVNRPPVLNPIGDRTVDEGTQLQFTISGTDPDGDQITYTASNLPKGATFDPGTGVFSWTPDYTQAGTYPDVQFTASDGSVQISQYISIVVNNVSPDKLINQLIEYIKTLELQKGIENSFLIKLDNVLKSLDNGNNHTAVNQIQALSNEVDAKRGTVVTDVEADEIIHKIQVIIEVINLTSII